MTIETLEQLAFLADLSLDDKIEKSIQTLRTYAGMAKENHPEGYYLAFSGGKDSVVIKHLAETAGVPFQAYYSQTTIDPPELVQFIRKHHSETIWNKPQAPFVHMVALKGLPSRVRRWCCDLYKENGGAGG